VAWQGNKDAVNPGRQGTKVAVNLFEVAKEIADRLASVFLRDEHDRRPVYGGSEEFQNDPYWRDHILFYEYFHGDNRVRE
jgi:hypothetical protein